jgi:hypothetical protein
MLNNMPLSANVTPLTQPRAHHSESAKSSVTRTLPLKENAAPACAPWCDTVGLGGSAAGLDLEAMSNPPTTKNGPNCKFCEVWTTTAPGDRSFNPMLDELLMRGSACTGRLGCSSALCDHRILCSTSQRSSSSCNLFSIPTTRASMPRRAKVSFTDESFYCVTCALQTHLDRPRLLLARRAAVPLVHLDRCVDHAFFWHAALQYRWCTWIDALTTPSFGTPRCSTAGALGSMR